MFELEKKKALRAKMRQVSRTSVRVVYDALTLNLAVILAIYVHFLSFLFRRFEGFKFTLDFYFTETQSALLLWSKYALVCSFFAILTFYAFGFYNLSRFRRARHKAFALMAGVSVANILILLIMYFNVEKDFFPRGVTLLLFCFSVLFNVMPRLAKPIIIFLTSLLTEPESVTKPVKKVLVIGGAGYIGSVLCQHLLNLGYSVRSFDLMLFGDESLRNMVGKRKFELVRGDFRNVADVSAALEDVDAVVHLGGLVGDPACSVNNELTIDTNYAATKMLADICKSRKIGRFVFASTCSVYGVGDGMSGEDTSVNPVSLYARTKIDSERILLEATDEHFRPTILRFATVFGWSLRPRFDLVVNTFVIDALTKGELQVHGGNQWRPFVHVFDLARSIELVLSNDIRKVTAQIFNVGDDRLNYTISDLAKLVVNMIPGAKYVNRGDVVDPRDYKVSFDKIKRQLGFQCEYTVENGVEEMIQAIKELKSIDATSKNYSNVKHLLSLIEENNGVLKNKLFMADLLSDGFVKSEYVKQQQKVSNIN